MYLEYNNMLLKQRSSINFEWLIVQNGDKEEYDFPCKIIKGKSLSSFPETNVFVNKNSHHHASGLDILLNNIKTRYVMFLDPDFFILTDLKDIMDYIHLNKIGVFGSPYSHAKKIQNFPVAFNMLIDLENVVMDGMTFSPDMTENGLINDTGSRIYNELSNRKDIKIECTNLYSASKIGDIYTWKNKLYAIHTRAKIHHSKNNNNIKARFNSQIDNVRHLIEQGE